MRGWVGPTITLFYITTSRTGGFARKLDVEKETERIYAGVEEPYSYTPVPVAKGGPLLPPTLTSGDPGLVPGGRGGHPAAG